MRINEVVAGIEGVAAGATATIRLPVNRRCHWLKFFPTATSDAQGNTPITDVANIVANVEIYVSGKLQRSVTPAFLKNWAAMSGITVPAGTLPIYFSEPQRASVMDEQASAWDLTGETAFTVRITFLAGIYNVGLSGIMCWDSGHAMDSKGQIRKVVVRQLPYNSNASAGTYDIVNLPVDRPINRIYLSAATGSTISISKVEVFADSLKIHEATATQLIPILRDYNMDATKFGYPVLFDVNQQLFDNLTVARDLLVRVTNTNGGGLNAIVETMAPGFL